jgi:hypothetical protein
MTPDQIKKLKDELVEATEQVVKLTVNGKIDKISTRLEEYINEDSEWKGDVEEYMGEMRPLKEGIHAIQTINKFIKWLGLPALGAIVAYWVIK